jgi:hypothetical protein
MNNYFLPYVPAVILLTVMGLRNLSHWDRGRGTGASLAGVLSLGCLVMLLLQIGAGALNHPRFGTSDLGRFDVPRHNLPSEIATELDSIPGMHLVLVRSSGEFLRTGGSTSELVWNLADTDSQRIVWAHDTNPEWTAVAVRYYKGRHVWLAEQSVSAFRLVPYPIDKLPPPPLLSTLPMPDRDIAEE